MLAGWTLAAAAAAWLEGWTDTRRGAVRATRGGLAVLALLVGAASHADPRAPPALEPVAFLVAAGALSASTIPAGAPLSLAALGCGATIGLIGPFLLLRLAPVPSGAGPLVAIAGMGMLTMVGRRALLAPPGPWRWLALVSGVPAGLTCISYSSDGEKGGLFVLLSAGLVATLLLLAAAARGLLAERLITPVRRDLEAALFRRAPERAGLLLLRFERWVVDAIGGAIVVLAYASAWALSRIDGRRP
jgi:hypothetical protein